jgi:hypothetical protein
MNDVIVLDGYLDEEVAADDTVGTRARFRLIVSPTDDLVDETSHVVGRSSRLVTPPA